MRPIYNDELYHFGIKGMRWGHHKIQQLQKYNNDYKKKINKIANSKTAHKSDVNAAKIANTPILKRIGKNIVGSAATVLIKDLLTGELKNYGNMSSSDLIKKLGSVGKSAARQFAINEITARSVANKYDINGERIKGNNKSIYTREDVVKKAIDASMIVGPILGRLGYLKLNKMAQQKKAGEAAFDRWGGRILTDKVSDYSHIIPNVSYTVR